ncbi:MAG TPA: Nif3-like dinuclear metal center hexameric protein [Oscillospiraceae bacterium]|nr:Nif3-like dinuclear metal center hexameric protein [Oscillospiraceae bacterium]
MSATVGIITEIIENLAPLDYAYKWDNVGLQLGYKGDTASKILTTLEITDVVLEEAVENGVDMIVAHHPMIFSPLKSIIKDDMKGRIIYKAIQNNIAIYVAHTNMDTAPGGLNDYITKQLNIQDIGILDVIEKILYYKLVVFVPLGYEEKVAEAISIAGAGHIGNYSHCTFGTGGIGTFKPLEGTKPFIGKQGQLEKVKEIRLETIVPEKKLKKIVKALIESHPYEEVAYDVYPLANKGLIRGIGRFGKLHKAKTVGELTADIKEQLNIEHVRVAGNLGATIEKIAVINGSGADLIQTALYKGCQCVITGDVKYHDAQDAISQAINVVDIGHYHSEKIFTHFIAEYLKNEIGKRGLDVDIIESSIDINPFQII